MYSIPEALGVNRPKTEWQIGGLHACPDVDVLECVKPRPPSVWRGETGSRSPRPRPRRRVIGRRWGRDAVDRRPTAGRRLSPLWVRRRKWSPISRHASCCCCCSQVWTMVQKRKFLKRFLNLKRLTFRFFRFFICCEIYYSSYFNSYFNRDFWVIT